MLCLFNLKEVLLRKLKFSCLIFFGFGFVELLLKIVVLGWVGL